MNRLPMSCCKRKNKSKNISTFFVKQTNDCGNDGFYEDGCFKKLEDKIHQHNSEGIAISAVISTILLVRIILSCFMAKQMRREKIWKGKIHEMNYIDNEIS